MLDLEPAHRRTRRFVDRESLQHPKRRRTLQRPDETAIFIVKMRLLDPMGELRRGDGKEPRMRVPGTAVFDGSPKRLLHH
jgi:hypothetical protein